MRIHTPIVEIARIIWSCRELSNRKNHGDGIVITRINQLSWTLHWYERRRRTRIVVFLKHRFKKAGLLIFHFSPISNQKDHDYSLRSSPPAFAWKWNFRRGDQPLQPFSLLAGSLSAPWAGTIGNRVTLFILSVLQLPWLSWNQIS